MDFTSDALYAMPLDDDLKGLDDKEYIRERVYVSKSGISGAGMGLFARRKIKKNEMIGEYVGEFLTKEQHEKRYPGDARSAYGVETELNDFIDASDVNESNQLRYANDMISDRSKTNARIVGDRHEARVFFEASKDIEPDEEIFANYGDEYWMEGKKTEGSSIPPPVPDEWRKNYKK